MATSVSRANALHQTSTLASNPFVSSGTPSVHSRFGRRHGDLYSELMGSHPDFTVEQRAASRLQLGVHHVLSGLAAGMVDTLVSQDGGIGMGDVDHAEMVLTESSPILIARHASLLEQIRVGLGDARVQRRKAAWHRLTACLESLAAVSGGHLPVVTPAMGYPPTVRFRCVVAPEPLSVAPMDGPVVFIAGGISGCPDFQATVISALSRDHVVLLNPRRAEFDLTDSNAVEQQVQWEVDHRWHESLAYILFWFPKSDSPQPIAMLELGDALARPALPIVIGADPRFPRHRDVVLQCRAARPGLTVHTSLNEVITGMQNLLRWQPT